MQTDVDKGPRKSPCSVRNAPVPETRACPACGAEVEIWTDDDSSACEACGRPFLRP